MKEKEIVSLEVAKKRSSKQNSLNGANYRICVAVISQITHAIEKYGELEDDGYYELTKQGGGTELWNNNKK